ncbi:MAG: hypothetical protein EPN47_18460 [Acidobacteria bacterium]|nr:MAG: hypothetical protein EPN47_18460 [Acidobacteriota bacterium]
MKYAYENLGDEQFETLIIFLCQRLLGIGVQGFSKGKDGGRDAKFVGTAELHPSKASPWSGTTIIQAKHTNGYNKSFSETDFHNPKPDTTSVLAEEIPRIKQLHDGKELDNYMLLANRRLAGNAESMIVGYISDKTGVPKPSIYLCGLEQLEIWLKKFPDVATDAKLDLVDSPLIVSPDELAEVVQAFADHKATITAVLDNPPTDRVSYAKKNATNNMTKDYADALLKYYLKETPQIQSFLAAPENLELLRRYETTIEEFQLKIIAKRKDYQSFDEVMNYLIDLLFERDPILRRHKRLTRTLLFYMYWHCDIGESVDITAN